MNLYFDNGATSFPKPPQVAESIRRYLDEVGGPYGRSFYERSLTVSSEVEDARDKLASFLGIADSGRLIFCQNATAAINIVIKGMELRGKLNSTDVLVTPLEHNAVMRPLNSSAGRCGIRVRTIPAGEDGIVRTDALSEMITDKTSLVIICHQSNVSGVVQPLEEIREAAGNTPVLVDASQSAGHIGIDADKLGFDFIAFTGHKGLLGPTGTGGLYVKNSSLIEPVIEGGTGSRSEEIVTPDFMPDRFEGGTPNIAGIFGLKAAIENRPEAAHSKSDFLNLTEKLADIKGLKILRADAPENQGEVLSLSSDKYSCSEFGSFLYDKFGIETRVGLHCAPSAHKYYGTFPSGTVRISPSIYHSPDDFDFLYDAVRNIQKS